MAKDFKIIVISSPDTVENESEKLTRLLEAGVDYVHIRKPCSSLREIKDLIEDIPYQYRKRIKLHGHFELLNEMNLGGAHLNSRNPVAPATAMAVSRSCHNLQECRENKDLEYVTLSPIYDSISKKNYPSAFNLNEKFVIMPGEKIIALGGVTPDKFFELRKKGFFGVALLGYIWNNDFDEALKALKTQIETI